MIKSTLNLFKAIQTTNNKPFYRTKNQIERMIMHGFFIDHKINLTTEIFQEVENLYGMSGKTLNNSFHKSWKVIRDSSMESLVLQQMVHYITTYGFESLGIYDENSVYIPLEGLEIPEVKNISLIYIKALTKEEILEKIINLGSGIALSKEVVDDVMIIVKENNYDSSFVKEIKNKELKSKLYEFYNIYPENSEEYLRYVINRLTGSSLLIKNRQLILQIKGSDGYLLDSMLDYAPKDLSSIFLRFKSLFLAMKSISKNRAFFNRLRKDSKKFHKPMKEDFLNSVTKNLKNNSFDFDKLKTELEKVNCFRKVRLANSLSYQVMSFYKDNSSILYRIRNGKGFASNNKIISEKLVNDFKKSYGIVFNSISEDIKKNLEGKTVYIPDNVFYTLPATEKQFTGNFPTGSYVSAKENLLVGIHWFNFKNQEYSNRIDLDLSMISQSGKTGWDGNYKEGYDEILFSGDMTDAQYPLGASELFYIKKGLSDSKILMVNDFTMSNKLGDILCKLVVGENDIKSIEKNYMIDPNKIIAQENIVIKNTQNIIGLIININNENRVYFYNVSIGNDISSYYNENSQKTKDYMINSCLSSLKFNNILKNAGIKVINELTDDIEEYVDLSPSALTKETFIDIMK